MLEEIKNTASFIRNSVDFQPQVGIILGSGLGALANHIEPVASLAYKDIPGFPVSTVAGHAGRMIFGWLGGKRVVAMQGRFHYYEGYTASQIGAILHKNSNTIYTLLARSKNMLREKLGGE